MVELPSQPPSATVIPARLEGGEGDEGRTGAAVTRSQKRKRDEEEALVERKASGASAETVSATAKAPSSKEVVGSAKVHLSPPHRPDDKDGHLQYELGESITPVYKILAPLGEGTFGRVLECWDRKSRSYCAIKIIRSVQKYRDAAMIEIDVLKAVQKSDPVGKFNCIKMETWFDYRGHICMVFEKCGLSLFDFLRKNHYKPFSSHLVQNFGRQLLRAVSFLHTLNLVHTDLKPENILLLSSAYQRIPMSSGSKFTKRVPMDSTIRLIDFGSATFENQYHSTVVSTRHYRAPEVILGMGWSYPCDVWSVGCILVELLTGDALFQTHENLEHLAMMEVVLGPIQPRVIKRADRHAQKYFRGGKELDWPEGSQSRESIRAVRKMDRLQEVVRSRLDEATARQFTNLLFSKFSRVFPCVRATVSLSFLNACVYTLVALSVYSLFHFLPNHPLSLA
mmetsp:Transcript_14541/g.23935  ORF Transcript_14541/g.23935 Transcript_14541/m.23935 type:complete len:452 (+) Transcript_14541:324-1679(+)